MSQLLEKMKDFFDSQKAEVKIIDGKISALKDEIETYKDRISEIAYEKDSTSFKWYELKTKVDFKKDLKAEKKFIEEKIIKLEEKVRELEVKRGEITTKTNLIKYAVPALAVIIVFVLIMSVVGHNSENKEIDTTTTTNLITGTTTTTTTTTTTESTTVDNRIALEYIPKYSGKAYVEINNNVPKFTDEDERLDYGYEYYSSLDSLGRCGMAFALVGEETMPTEERDEIGQVKPTGWHTVKYDCVSGKYLYNRCHLIGYNLSNENANVKNLITGTCYLNIEGMLPFENMVADYVKETGNHVLYRVTPIFEEDNLLASGVQMEAWSVEDDGDGICFNVYCYNVQPEVIIDYETGDSELEEPETTKETTTKKQTTTKSSDDNSMTVYITNTGTKYHLEGCRHLKSKIAISKSKAISQGYEPCGTCNPG